MLGLITPLQQDGHNVGIIGLRLMRYLGFVHVINFGSENYSGKKIPWTEMSVSVRFRPELQIAKQGNGKPVQFILEECEYVKNYGLRKWSCRSFLNDNVH